MDTPASPSSLGVFDIIKRSLVVYREIIGRLVGYFLLAALLGGLVMVVGIIAAIVVVGLSATSLKGADSSAVLTTILGHLGGLLIIAPIFFILIMLVQLWLQATIILTAARANANIQQNSWSGTLGEAWKSLGRLFLGVLPKALISIAPIICIYGAMGLLFGMLFGGVSQSSRIGSLTQLLFLGGIVCAFLSVYLNVRWFFTEYAIVLEKLKPVDGLKRSSQIVKGRWWGVLGRILGIGLLLWLGVIIAIIVLQIIFGSNSGIASFVSFVLELFVTPLVFTAFTVLFEGMRATPAPVDAPFPPAPAQTPPAPQA